MTTKYLLRCDCGLEVAVQRVQAGQKVECTCGKQVDVPMLRDFDQLEVIGPTEDERPQWNVGPALLGIGGVLLVAAVIAGVYLFFNRPIQPKLANYPPVLNWAIWIDLQRGVEGGLGPDIVAYNIFRQRYHIRMVLLAVLGLSGVVCLGIGYSVRKSYIRQSTNTTSSLEPSTSTGSSSR
jgi:hypothetical protein